MSDFSDRPLVAGSVVGLRAFDVDALGRLVGPTYPDVFKPGVNDATCHRFTQGGGTPGFVTLSGNIVFATTGGGGTYTLDGGKTWQSSRSQINPDPDHVVGTADCTCGYYAYFNGENVYAQADRVTALIRGTGVCTVGNKGFRASKAELVALVLPQAKTRAEGAHPLWFDRYSDYLQKHQGLGAVLGGGGFTVGPLLLAFGIALAIDVSWLFAALSPLGIALLAQIPVTFKADCHSIDREFPLVSVRQIQRCSLPPKGHAPQVSGVNWELVRAAYPDVPTYPTVEAALVDHPLTPPPTPTPADADFWDRNAS